MKESGDAVTFTFGAARDRKTALGLTACFLFMLPFAGVFILYDGELPFWVAFWLLVFVVVLGGLSFVTWTYASRITVGGGTLRYVRGPFGKGSERCLFAPDIVGLEVGMDGEVLGKARYKIIARLRDARPMKLAGGLQDRREAAWIADRLNRALVQDEVRFG